VIRLTFIHEITSYFAISTGGYSKEGSNSLDFKYLIEEIAVE